MSSHTTTYRKMLRRAQGAVRSLKTAGHSTMALEVELRRGEQAITRKHWAEAKEHLDTVLANMPPPRPTGADALIDAPDIETPRSFSDPERKQVADKLAMARDRLAILDQFGISTADLLTSLHRADSLLSHGYSAQAEALADELLVMTKAAAEGLEMVAHKAGLASAQPSNGSGPHHDFLSALRGALADLVKGQGWQSELQVRSAIQEALAPLPRAADIEARLVQLGQRLDETAQALRHDRAVDTEEVQARLNALRSELDSGLGDLRRDLETLANSSADAATRNAEVSQALAKLEADLARQRTAVEGQRAEQNQAMEEHGEALAQHLADSLQELREELVNALATSDKRITAHGGTLADLADVVGRLDATSSNERSERIRQAEVLERLAHQLKGLPERLDELDRRSGGAVHEQAQILIALESGLDALRTDVSEGRVAASELYKRLEREVQALASGLAERAEMIDVQRISVEFGERIAAFEQRLAERDARTANSGQDATARLECLASDLGNLKQLAGGLGELQQRLAALESQRTADVQRVVSEQADHRAERERALAELRGQIAGLHAQLVPLTTGLEDLAALAKRSDDLEQRLTQAVRSIAEQREQFPEVVGRIEQDLGKRIETLSQDLADRLGALDQSLAASRQETAARLETLDARTAQAMAHEDDRVPQERLDALIRALRGEINAAVSGKADAAALVSLRSELTSALSATVDRGIIDALRDELAATASAKVDATTVDEAIARIAQALAVARQEDSSHFASIEAKLDTATKTLESALAAKADAGHIDALTRRFDQALIDLRREAGEHFSALDAGVAKANANTDAIPASRLDAAITALRHEFTALVASKADSGQMEAIADRVAQLLATTRQEDEERFAAFETRLNAAASSKDSQARDDLNAIIVPLRDELAAKADATTINAVIDRLEKSLAVMRDETAKRLSALDSRLATADDDRASIQDSRIEALAKELRASLAKLADGKADASRLEAFAKAIDERIVRQDAVDIAYFDRIIVGLREAIDSKASLDQLTALNQGIDDERIVALEKRIDALASAPDQRLATLEQALAERPTLAQVEDAAQRHATMIPELSARLDSLALDFSDLVRQVRDQNPSDGIKQVLASMQDIQARLGETDRRISDLARIEERLKACETALATSGASASSTQLPERILQLIQDNEDFRALVSRQVAVSMAFNNPHSQDEEQLHKKVAELARRLDQLQTHDAPAFVSEVAELRKQVESLASRPSGSGSALDAKAIRDQVIENLRPLIPRSEKVVEVINAAVAAAMQRLPPPQPAAFDPKVLRKMMPDLLSAPEIRSTIISTVLLEALSNKGSLGNLSGIRQVVHDELLRIIAERNAERLSGTRPPVAHPPGQGPAQPPANRPPGH